MPLSSSTLAHMAGVLGQSVDASTYAAQHDPSLLFPIPRTAKVSMSAILLLLPPVLPH